MVSWRKTTIWVILFSSLLMVFLFTQEHYLSIKPPENLNDTPYVSRIPQRDPPPFPVVKTPVISGDIDDPAIWINEKNPLKSLVLGTVKKDNNGAIYVFDLEGNIIYDRIIKNLSRPNNVDVEYGLVLGDTMVDIAVFTERNKNMIRVYSLPELEPLDNGGIEVFLGEKERLPMGVALYKRPSDGDIFVLISRKQGGRNGTNIWQYLLKGDESMNVRGKKIREFGNWSGIGEIESIAVDDQARYVYYSDEKTGIRKYYADPDERNSDVELAFFGRQGFIDDREGISIYPTESNRGYIVVSDQMANEFHIYTREGIPTGPHSHVFLGSVKLAATTSDGSDVTSKALSHRFPEGLFVAMSDEKSFHYYSWKDIIENITSAKKF